MMNFHFTCLQKQKTHNSFSQNYLSDELVRYTVRLILSRPEEVPESRAGMLPLISAITATALPQHDMKAALDVVMTHKSLRLDSVSWGGIWLHE